MAISLVGTGGSSGSTDITLPAMQEDDVVFVFCTADNAGVIITPSGYTSEGFDDATASVRWSSSYKVMGSTPDTSVTGFNAGGSQVAVVLRGVDTSRVIDAPASTNVVYGNMPDCPRIRTSTDGAWVLAVGHLDDDAVAASVTAPTNYTLAIAEDDPTSTTMVAYREIATAGYETPGEFGGSGADLFAGRSIAIRPANAGPPSSVSEITRVGTAASSNNTDIILSGGMQEDDLVIFAGSADQDSVVITPTGFTSIGNARTGSVGWSIAYKWMGATPDDTISGLNFGGSQVAVILRGVDNTTPLDVATPSVASGETGMPDAPSITPVTDDAWVLAFGHLDDDAESGTVTAPTNYTLLAVADRTDADFSTTMVAYRKLATAAVENPAAFGGSGTDAWAANVIALRPAATGGTDATAEPGAGSATGLGYAPTVSAGATTTPANGTASGLGYAPTVTAAANATSTPAHGTASGTGYAPTVSAGSSANAQPATGTASGLGFAPGVSASVSAAPGAGATTGAGFAPIVATGASAAAQPGTGTAMGAGFAPAISANSNTAPGTGNVTGLGFAPAVSSASGATAQPGTGTASGEGYAPIVSSGVSVAVEAPTGTAIGLGFAPSTAATSTVALQVGTASGIGFAPNVFSGEDAVTPTDRTFAVEQEDRAFSIPIEDRTMKVA